MARKLKYGVAQIWREENFVQRMEGPTDYPKNQAQ
jgi:hypothetical protein